MLTKNRWWIWCDVIFHPIIRWFEWINVTHLYTICMVVSVHHNTTTILQWRHDERDGVSPASRLFIQLFIHTQIKIKIPKLRVTGLFDGNSPETSEQKATNAENVSIWWRHHAGNTAGYSNPGHAAGVSLDYITGINEHLHVMLGTQATQLHAAALSGYQVPHAEA